jgi:hypothetical protein
MKISEDRKFKLPTFIFIFEVFASRSSKLDPSPMLIGFDKLFFSIFNISMDVSSVLNFARVCTELYSYFRCTWVPLKVYLYFSIFVFSTELYSYFAYTHALYSKKGIFVRCNSGSRRKRAESTSQPSFPSRPVLFIFLPRFLATLFKL